MSISKELAAKYSAIIREELITALGCTEPIAIAFAAAKATEVLGKRPERILAKCSGNVVKNVKGVVVPHTGNLKGIEIAATVGSVAGDPNDVLEVLNTVTDQDVAEAKRLVANGICTVELLNGGSNLHIIVEVHNGSEWASVEISDYHTNIVRVEKNGFTIFQKDPEQSSQILKTDRSCLCVDCIYQYIQSDYVYDAKEYLLRQIEYNSKIAQEGLEKEYGARIGKTLLNTYGNEVKILAKAMAAAGSDARMSGCDMPVVINSGSGNQGLTVSLPVIVYTRSLGADDDQLLRALALSNLISIHIKSMIGTLSAFCGAVSAACGSGAAITYLHGGSLEQISNTVTNTLANVSGIICDGAKPSCAAKIASSVDAAILAHNMSMQGIVFEAGDGILKPTLEDNIRNIGKIARDGMTQTDKEILSIMIEC